LDTKLNLRIFFTLFLAVFATTLGVGLVAPLLPVYAHGLGAGAFQIGLIFGAFSLTRTLFVPLFGRLSDLRGRKPFLVSGLLLYAFLSVCYVFSRSVTTLVMVRLGQGFASAMILPVAQAYVGVITPPGREGFTMGLFNMALFGGLSAGPLLGGAVKDLFGIQTSFLSMAALCLAGFSLCLSLLPPEAPPGPAGGDGHRRSRYGRLLGHRPVLALFVFRLGFTTCIGMIWTFLPLLAGTRHGLTSTETGVVVMINVLVSGLLQTPMGYVADRVGKRGLIATGGLLASAAMVALHHASSFGQLFLANALLGVSGGLSFPAVMALGVIQGRRGEQMGSVMGVLAMAHSMGMLAGPLMGGLILDLTSFGFLFGSGAAIIGGGTLLFLVLAAEPRRRARRGSRQGG
jgi:MFS family permease